MNRRLTTALLLTLACAGSVQAQMFGSSESKQVGALREEMEARFSNMNRAQFELLNQNTGLRDEVARLRGQIEVLQHEVESLRSRQQDFYVDLDSRLLRLESPGQATPGSSAPQANAAEESADYEAALELLKQGKHAESLAAFRSFISRYPSSNFQPNAHFWAGNAALQAKEVAAARSLFEKIISTWPQDAVVPDAMLGLANSQQLLGERRAANETLGQIISRHPDSSAAQIARQRIQP